VLVTSVPLCLGFLGREKYGAWMTLGSLTYIVAFGDFGLGNGLLNALSAANGRDDRESARVAISNGLAMLLLIGALVLGASLAFGTWVDWRAVLAVTGVERQEFDAAALVLLSCVALGIPIGVAQRVRVAYQRGYVQSAWSILGHCSSLAALWIAVRWHAPLLGFVLATTGTSVCAQAANAAVLAWKHPELRPKLRDLQPGHMRALAQTGAGFFVLQICSVLMFNFDNIVIARSLGVGAVANYSVAARVAALIPVGVGLILTPLWPAYGEAAARGDWDWVRGTLRRSLTVVTVSMVPAVCVMVALGPSAVELWTSARVHVDRALVIALSAQVAVTSLAIPLSVGMNGLNALRVQVLLAIPQTLAAVALKVWSVGRFGVWAVPASTAICQMVLWNLPAWLLLPSIVRRVCAGDGRIRGELTDHRDSAARCA